MAPGNIKMPLKISDLKTLNACWLIKMCDYLKQQKGSILNGFDKRSITEAVKSANEVFARIENLLQKNKHCRYFFA